MTSFSYVVPAYNEAETLPRTVALLVERLRAHPGSEIIVVENGSSDATGAVARHLADEHAASDTASRAPRVVAASSDKGLGNALRRGIELARADWICCTAADLPFGFTDLDGFLALDPDTGIVIGSKGHPASSAPRSLLRRTMTAAFRILRLALLGMRVRDPQGSVFVERRLGQRIGPQTRDGGFLFGTELVALAQADGAPVREVPVVLEPLRGGSTVRPVQDSLLMLRGLFDLRARLRRDRAVSAMHSTLAAEPAVGLGRVPRRLPATGLVLSAVALLLGGAVVAAGMAATAWVAFLGDRLQESSGPLRGRPIVATGLVGLGGCLVLAAGAALARIATRASTRTRPLEPDRGS